VLRLDGTGYMSRVLRPISGAILYVVHRANRFAGQHVRAGAQLWGASFAAVMTVFRALASLMLAMAYLFFAVPYYGLRDSVSIPSSGGSSAEATTPSTSGAPPARAADLQVADRSRQATSTGGFFGYVYDKREQVGAVLPISTKPFSLAIPPGTGGRVIEGSGPFNKHGLVLRMSTGGYGADAIPRGLRVRGDRWKS
jgi:hypothetical protein